MAAPSEEEFAKWLSEKLLKINSEVDLDIFVTYIISILETESTEDEQKEDLIGFLTEIAEDDVEGHCDEILKKWQISSGGKRLNEDGCTDNNTVIDQFHSIVEKQQSQKISSRELTTEEKARKSAILAQYGHISDGEVTDDDVDPGEVGTLSKNINALSVSERETELRERMKQEHENKKLKDKEDRERQKQKAVERKAAEKKRTQKGEHRR